MSRIATFLEAVARLFQADADPRDGAEKWAVAHYRGANEASARTVVYALVTMLNVKFEQLTPATDIVRELRADEWTEWHEIFLTIEEELGGQPPEEPPFQGSTIAELVDYVAQQSKFLQRPRK